MFTTLFTPILRVMIWYLTPFFMAGDQSLSFLCNVLIIGSLFPLICFSEEMRTTKKYNAVVCVDLYDNIIANYCN